jgi:coenzyme F420-reducing hydrogenase beta subunit
MKDKNIQKVIDKDICTGCSSCVSICPYSAISMEENELGFLTPKIDLSLCKNCDLCSKICPVLNFNENNSKILSGFAGWSNDKENIIHSSSGGIFYELAKWMIKKRGFVCGVVMEGKRPVYKISNNLNEIKKMRGSKYLQADVSKITKNILRIKSKPILFVGTPCQIAGLKNIFKERDRNLNNILFIDLICSGIPSYLIFDKYIEHLKIKNNFYINFRFKRPEDWENYLLKIVSGKNIFISSFKKDKFMQLFLSKLSFRNSCYDCKFLKFSLADMTIGDFWGCPEEIKNKNGTSAIIIHTSKGEKIIKELSFSKKIILHQTNISVIAQGNPKIISGIIKKPKNREKFLNSIKENNFEYSYSHFIKRRSFLKRIILLIYSFLSYPFKKH